jgi:hypothetical protein
MVGMSNRKSHKWEAKEKILKELIQYGKSKSDYNDIIKILERIITNSNIQCDIDYHKLKEELQLFAQQFSHKFHFIIYLVHESNRNKANETLQKLNTMCNKLLKISDERMVETDYRNSVKRHLDEICYIIWQIFENARKHFKNRHNTSLLNTLDTFIYELAKENRWFDACINNNLETLFNKFVDCVISNYIAKMRYIFEENLIEFVQNRSSIPVTIIQHKPVKYLRVIFGDDESDGFSVEIVELLYSLAPFVLYKRDDRYYIFIPEKRYVEGEFLPAAKILVPYKIRLLPITSNDISYFWYNKRQNRKSLKFQINENAIYASSGKPVYVCSLGFLPLAMQPICDNYDCPRRSKCYNPQSNKFNYLKDINDSYMRIFNVVLETEKNVHILQSTPILKLFILDGSKIQEAITISLDVLSVLLSIDKVIFQPREKYSYKFILEPNLKIRINGYKLGLRLFNTKALTVRLNKNILEEIIREILNSNKQIANYICLKYRAFNKKDKFIYEKLLEGADYILNGNGCYVDDKLIDYAVNVFAHTFAHLLLSFIASKLQVEPLRILDYYYEIDENYVKVLVYELGEGGLGLLERQTLQVISSLRQIMEQILDYIKPVYNTCENKIFKIIQIGNSYVNSNVISKDVKQIWEKYISNAYTNFGITLNAQTLRIPIWDLVFKDKLNPETAHELLSVTPVCMDGCNYCVLLERGCFKPLDQLITTSRSLFHDVFTKLYDNIEKSLKKFNEILSKPSDERAELFFDFLRLASRSIKIVTYVIDKYAAERLAELKASKNVDIMVVTNSESLSEDIRHLLTASGIQVRTMPNIHAKIYIVDDAIALIGSANLTKKALTENHENIELKTDLDEIKRLADSFVEIWNNARQSEI